MPLARLRSDLALATVRPLVTVHPLATVRQIIPLLPTLVTVPARTLASRGGMLNVGMIRTYSRRRPMAVRTLLIMARTAPDPETHATTLAPMLIQHARAHALVSQRRTLTAAHRALVVGMTTALHLYLVPMVPALTKRHAPPP